MTKKRESYISFFLRNIKNFSSTLSAFNDLEASCAKSADDHNLVRKNKLKLVDFLTKFISQIELIFEHNTEDQFTMTSIPLTDIQEELSTLDSQYSTTLEIAASNLDIIIDFMFLTEGEFHCINFFGDEAKAVKKSLNDIKSELSSINEMQTN